GANAGHRQLVPAIGASRHRVGAVEHQLDLTRRRRPQAERRFVATEARSEPRLLVHRTPSNARTARGGACDIAPTGMVSLSGPPSTTVVPRSRVQPRQPGHAGTLNGIGSGAALSTM